MTFKYLIFKAITNLASFIGYNFTFKRRKNVFEGIYKSYNEALSNSGNIDSYINKRIQSKIETSLIAIDFFFNPCLFFTTSSKGKIVIILAFEKFFMVFFIENLFIRKP